jgi:hypothetical protein
MLRAFGAAGFRLARSFATLIPTPASTHIFAAAGTPRVPLSQPQKRHIPPERYAKCPPDFIKSYWLDIIKIIVNSFNILGRKTEDDYKNSFYTSI